jgi:hypothetical protein
MQFFLKIAKHVHAKFLLSSFDPDGLRQTFFQVNFRILLKKFQNLPILKNNSKKSNPNGIFYQILNHLGFLQKFKTVLNCFWTLDFSQEISKFQNSEYELHQSRPNDEG